MLCLEEKLYQFHLDSGISTQAGYYSKSVLKETVNLTCSGVNPLPLAL
ncbi:MAG: hypothetical protein RLZZ184_4083 [Cyanobacteriota bacterium]